MLKTTDGSVVTNDSGVDQESQKHVLVGGRVLSQQCLRVVVTDRYTGWPLRHDGAYSSQRAKQSNLFEHGCRFAVVGRFVFSLLLDGTERIHRAREGVLVVTKPSKQGGAYHLSCLPDRHGCRCATIVDTTGRADCTRRSMRSHTPNSLIYPCSWSAWFTAMTAESDD